MPDDIEIIRTADGSHSLLNKALDETYHSRHGALQESLHVFIKNGLQYFFETRQQQHIRIFEMGFGTGLNAWLTEKWASDFQVNISYTTVELSPIPAEIFRHLNYAIGDEDKKRFQRLHTSSWNTPHLFDRFTFLKSHGDIEALKFDPRSSDIIFYDAFAPSKQPEMWTLDRLSQVVALLDEAGLFVTYCAQGQLKRNLKSLGLTVETLAGPPGKKEMVRALKI